ncbi:MAG: acylphosphatase [Acidobacteriota bacterium]|nr:acylphosphatase [Acidobacteriota bacterium]
MRWFWRRDKGSQAEPSVPEGAVRRRLRYAGRVQAVGFRFTAQGWAQQHGLTGWVTNRSDGDVELEVQGTPEQVRQFMAEVEAESARPGAFIRARLVRCDELPPVPERRFAIRA